jgi:hypothetical protein
VRHMSSPARAAARSGSKIGCSAATHRAAALPGRSLTRRPPTPPRHASGPSPVHARLLLPPSPCAPPPGVCRGLRQPHPRLWHPQLHQPAPVGRQAQRRVRPAGLQHRRLRAGALRSAAVGLCWGSRGAAFLAIRSARAGGCGVAWLVTACARPSPPCAAEAAMRPENADAGASCRRPRAATNTAHKPKGLEVPPAPPLLPHLDPPPQTALIKPS